MYTDPEGLDAAALTATVCASNPIACSTAAPVVAVGAAALGTGVAIGYYGVGVVANMCTGSDGEETDDEGSCEELYRIDTETCNGIAKARGSQKAALCHASAAERYAACMTNKPLPPLNTWNN